MAQSHPAGQGQDRGCLSCHFSQIFNPAGSFLAVPLGDDSVTQGPGLLADSTCGTAIHAQWEVVGLFLG